MPHYRLTVHLRHPLALAWYLLVMGFSGALCGRYLYLHLLWPLSWSIVGGWLSIGVITFLAIALWALALQLLGGQDTPEEGA